MKQSSPADGLRAAANLTQDGDKFSRLHRLADEMEKSDAVKKRLMGLYRQRPAVTERAEWCQEDSTGEVMQVCVPEKPKGDAFQAAMHSLAGAIAHRHPDKIVVDVCHGIFRHPEWPNGIWCCFAKLGSN